MKKLLLSLLVVLFWLPFGAASAQWVTLRGCQLVPHTYRDGDSFQVQHEGRRFIVRLYFVDAPETDTTNAGAKKRVAAQRKYFGVSEKTVLAAGKAAAHLTESLLQRPFTVVTKGANARGNSQLPRYFGFVTTADGQDLGEVLLARGLARSYGRAQAPPGKSVREFWKKYDRLEQLARDKKIGIFAPQAANTLGRSGSAAASSEPAQLGFPDTVLPPFIP